MNGARVAAGEQARRTRAASSLVWLAAGTAAALVWLATSSYGPGVDADGVWTVSAAASLARGEGLVTCRGELYSLWPPLYPLLLAAGEWLGLDSFTTVRVLHALAFAGTIALTARIVIQASGSAWLGVAQAWTLAASLVLHRFTILVGSEPLFIALCAVAIWVELGQLERPTRLRLVALTTLGALACLQRYLGVALVIALAAGLLWSRRDVGARRRWREAAIVAGGAALPLCAWLARNWWLEGKATGGRTPASQSLAQIFGDVLTTLRTWATPGQESPGVALWLALVVCLLAAVGLLRVSAAHQRVEQRRAALALLGFTAIHTFLLVALSARYLVDRVESRLMLPALPFLVGATLVGLHAVAARLHEHGRVLWRVAQGALTAGIVVHVAVGASTLASALSRWSHEGAGNFHVRHWDEHDVVRWLRRERIETELRSNLPELVWLETRQPVSFLKSARKLHERLGQSVSASGVACTIVWFSAEGKPVLFADELERNAHVETLAQFEDGLVARVLPR